jgi:hypothetical protein
MNKIESDLVNIIIFLIVTFILLTLTNIAIIIYIKVKNTYVIQVEKKNENC